jgi:c-di-GMP-related signal transduction protein
MATEDLKSALKSDSEYRRYRSICSSVETSLPYEALCEEIDQIQVARQVRTSALSEMKPRELLSVSMDEVSHRARLSEILVHSKRRRHDLGAVMDGMWNYIASEYHDELKDLRTKDERSTAITAALKKGYAHLASLDSLVDQCETAIKDIDQTSFSLSRIASLYELIIRKEHLVNVDV